METPHAYTPQDYHTHAHAHTQGEGLGSDCIGSAVLCHEFSHSRKERGNHPPPLRLCVLQAVGHVFLIRPALVHAAPRTCCLAPRLRSTTCFLLNGQRSLDPSLVVIRCYQWNLWRVVLPRGGSVPPEQHPAPAPPPPAVHPPVPDPQNPLHWGYTAWGTTPSVVPPRPPPVKRPLSDSEDCDDVFSEESSKDQ